MNIFNERMGLAWKRSSHIGPSSRGPRDRDPPQSAAAASASRRARGRGRRPAKAAGVQECARHCGVTRDKARQQMDAMRVGWRNKAQ